MLPVLYAVLWLYQKLENCKRSEKTELLLSICTKFTVYLENSNYLTSKMY